MSHKPLILLALTALLAAGSLPARAQETPPGVDPAALTLLSEALDASLAPGTVRILLAGRGEIPGEAIGLPAAPRVPLEILEGDVAIDLSGVGGAAGIGTALAALLAGELPAVRAAGTLAYPPTALDVAFRFLDATVLLQSRALFRSGAWGSIATDRPVADLAAVLGLVPLIEEVVAAGGGVVPSPAPGASPAPVVTLDLPAAIAELGGTLALGEPATCETGPCTEVVVTLPLPADGSPLAILIAGALAGAVPPPDPAASPGPTGSLTIAIAVDDATDRLAGIDATIASPLLAARGGSEEIGLAIVFARYGAPVKVAAPKKTFEVE